MGKRAMILVVCGMEMENQWAGGGCRNGWARLTRAIRHQLTGPASGSFIHNTIANSTSLPALFFVLPTLVSPHFPILVPPQELLVLSCGCLLPGPTLYFQSAHCLFLHTTTTPHPVCGIHSHLCPAFLNPHNILWEPGALGCRKCGWSGC